MAGLSTSAVLLLAAGLHAVHTVLVAGTLRVALFCRRTARQQRIAQVSLRAATLHTVIDDLALRARATLAERCARIRTLLVDAGLRVAALVVRSTPCLTDASLADQSIATGRIAVAHSSARSPNAPLVGQTVLIVTARLHAGTAVACLPLRTVGARLTEARLLPAAQAERIAHQTGRAAALLPVSHDHTLGVRATGRRLLAWIDALLPAARQMVRTSAVRSATDHTRLTLADLPRTAIVILAADRLARTAIAAFVVQAALIVRTHWPAKPVDAGRTVGTVAILRTL